MQKPTSTARVGLRAFLLGIIVLTIPCYLIGGVALFLAPPPRGTLAQSTPPRAASATATTVARPAPVVAATPTRTLVPPPPSTPTPKPTLAPTQTSLPPATLPPTPLPPTFTAIPSPTPIQATPTVTPTIAIPPTPSAVPAPTNTPGRQFVTVPRVIGMEEKEAIKAVEAAGLQVRQVIKRKIQGYPEGRVWGQSLGPGARVASGTMMDLIVATK